MADSKLSSSSGSSKKDGVARGLLDILPTAALGALAAAAPPIGLPLLAIAGGLKLGQVRAKAKADEQKEQDVFIMETLRGAMPAVFGSGVPQGQQQQPQQDGVMEPFQLLPGLGGLLGPQQQQQAQSQQPQTEFVGPVTSKRPATLGDPAALRTASNLGKVKLGSFTINMGDAAEQQAIYDVTKQVASGVSPTDAFAAYAGIISPENQRMLASVIAAEVFQKELQRVTAANKGLTREQATELARVNTVTLTGGLGVPEALQDPIFESQLAPETRAELELSGTRPELASPAEKQAAQAGAQQRATTQAGAETEARTRATQGVEQERFLTPAERSGMVGAQGEPPQGTRLGDVTGAFGTTAPQAQVQPQLAEQPPVALQVHGQPVQYRARRDRPLASQQEAIIFLGNAVAALEEMEDLLTVSADEKANLTGLGAPTAQAIRERVPAEVRGSIPFIGTTPQDYERKSTFKFLGGDYKDALLRARSGAQTGEAEMGRLSQLAPDLGLDETENLNRVRNAIRSLRGLAASNIALNRQLGLEEPDFDIVLADVIRARLGAQ